LSAERIHDALSPGTAWTGDQDRGEFKCQNPPPLLARLSCHGGRAARVVWRVRSFLSPHRRRQLAGGIEEEV